MNIELSMRISYTIFTIQYPNAIKRSPKIMLKRYNWQIPKDFRSEAFVRFHEQMQRKW